MKRMKRLLLGIGCALLLAVSWLAALTAESDAQRQVKLIEQAAAYTQDEIYVRAIPLLEEAAGYDDKYTLEAEEALKDAYLNMLDQSGYARKYTNLLEKQMARKDAAPEIYAEAAEYYLETGKETEAFAALRSGIEKTGSAELTELYEDTRYAFKLNRATYQDATATCNGAIQVKLDGFWGLANSAGELVVPCEFDAISTFSNGQAIARQGGLIIGVDQGGNRVALLHGEASEFTNFGDNRVGLRTADGWTLADGNFYTGGSPLQDLGMFSNGAAAAKTGGKWGLLATDGETWLLAPEYDGIIQDQLGRSYAQDAVFVRQGGDVRLLVDGEAVGETYEDARPFADGWAAVKQNGKWGFIDTQGNVCIDFQFDDALSFGQHLAAVKVGDLWGYVSLGGEVVIDPVFLEAGSFYEGSAPVRTADGWQFITLLEFKKGAASI